MARLYSLPPSVSDSELLSAALHYAASGWRVFPVHGWRDDCCTCGDPSCPRPAKHPLTHHGLHDASTDEGKIRQWWHQWPDANIGVCAEDIGVVMDIDPRNGGDASLDRLIAEYGVLPETVEVMTGGGGTHYYFRSPVRLSKGGLEGYPGIDVQAAGGYVIAPPSLHRSGRRYEFEASSDLMLGQPIGECPAWLFRLRGEAAPLRPKSRTPLPELSPATPEILHEVIDALSAIDPDIEHGAWVKIGQAIHSQLWTEGFDLWDQWSALGRKYKGRQRTLRKWNTFNADGNAQGAQVGLATVFFIAKQAGWQRVVAQQSSFTPPPPGESLIILACDLPTTLRPPEWLAEDYVEAGALSVLFGEPGAGKSFLALDLALSVATMRTWHGQPVKRTPVVYLCGEGHAGLQRRMHAWRDWHQVDWRSAPFAMTKRAVPLTNRQAIEALKRDIDAVVERLGDAPGFFVVDTLARNFGAGDENSTKDMSVFIDYVGAYLMDAYKACVMLVHHTGHGDKQRARGSSSLKGAVDAEYFVQQTEGRIIELSGLKMKDAPLPKTMHFGMRVMQLGEERPGKPMTSVVPVPVAAPQALDRPPQTGKGSAQERVLDLLANLYASARGTLERGGFDPNGARVAIEDLRDGVFATGIFAGEYRRQRFSDCLKSLEKAGLVYLDRPYIKPS